MNKAERLKELYKLWADCKRCPLHEKRKHVVLGQGNPDADILVLGIGPGEEEDKTGNPFWGTNGEIMDDYLKAIQYKRTDLYLLNIVACRPTIEIIDPNTRRKRTENRDPTGEEKEACQQLWLSALYIVDPILIVAYGKPTIAELSKKRGIRMERVHGTIQDCTVPGLMTSIPYPVMPMYHPDFLSGTGDKSYGGVWHQALVDWQRAIYYVDQLRHRYYGEPPPDRGFNKTDLFINPEEVFLTCQGEQSPEGQEEM